MKRASESVLTALAGPVDRDDFFAAQRRHRRAALLLSALAGIAVVFVSVPLAAIVFPLIFAVLSLLSLVASAATGSETLLDWLMATGGHFAQGPNAVLEAIVLGLVIVLPGSLLMLVIWQRSLRVLGSLDPARLVALFGARLVGVGDLEERQVSNIVEELAIAAGIPAPAVHVVDSETVNAAAVAPDPDGALVLVTRGLLDHCDRAETQALLGSVVAMIANGDAQASFRWMGAAAAFNIAADLLHGPLGKVPRERLKVLLPTLRSRTLIAAGGAPIPDAARVIAILLAAPPDAPDDLHRGRLKTAVLFPFQMASSMFNMVGFLANHLFLSPALALLMRRRRYLADATAVQLTRDPDSLARGLGKTVNQTAAGDWPLARFRPMFLVAPTQIDGDPPLGQSFGTHPSVAARHERVVRMGAMARSTQGSPFAELSGRQSWLAASLGALACALMVILVPLMLYLMIAVTLFALVVGMMFVLIVLLPLYWLLG